MAVDRSLRALGLDHIDLYQVHWPVTGTPPEETMGAMHDLRATGKIRAVGVSNYHEADLRAAVASAPASADGTAALDSYQAGYHLMRREIEEAELPWCAAHSVGVLVYGPLAHGLLTGKMDETTTFAPDDWRAASELFADDAFAERIAVVGELAQIADQAGRAGGVAELAVVWALRRPEVTSAIVGARDADQAVRNAALTGAPLSADEQSAIDDVLARHPLASRPYGHGEPPDPARQDGD